MPTYSGSLITDGGSATTLADITYQVAKIVMPDNMADGTATAGTTTSLTDTDMQQPNEYFNKGMLWIRSGSNSGKLLAVTGHFANKLVFSSIGATAIAVGDRYAVARNVYPLAQIKSAIWQALQETHIEAEDATLIGDGETLEFTLPAGVFDVKRVRIEHPTEDDDFYFSSHWKEQTGKIKFDYGYAPEDDYLIRLIYRSEHAELTAATDEIDAEINVDWLKYKAAEHLLLWGMGAYGTAAEYRIEERMNMVLERLKRLTARRGGPDIIMRTAGA